MSNIDGLVFFSTKNDRVKEDEESKRPQQEQKPVNETVEEKVEVVSALEETVKYRGK